MVITFEVINSSVMYDQFWNQLNERNPKMVFIYSYSFIHSLKDRRKKI